MNIVTTPTIAWLKEAIACCKQEVLIASPFVGAALNQELQGLPAGVERRLITRTELPAFASGASDLEAVIHFAEQGGFIGSLSGLHAKVYVFDRTIALVTSANATYSGFHRNWECGVVVHDAHQVNELVAAAHNGFGSVTLPQPWKCSELKALRPVVAQLQSVLPSASTTKAVHGGNPEMWIIPRSAWNETLESMSGWMKLTLNAILQIGNPEFVIDQVYASGLPLAQTTYPKNRNRREKIRQQLQRLRDLGIVEFLGGGNYRLILRPE